MRLSGIVSTMPTRLLPPPDLLPPLLVDIARLDCEMSWEKARRVIPYSERIGELAEEACLSAERLALSLRGRPCRTPSPPDIVLAENIHILSGGCSARMRSALRRLVGKPVWLRLLELGVDTGVLGRGLPWRLSGIPAPAPPPFPPGPPSPERDVFSDPPEYRIKGVSAIPVVRRKPTVSERIERERGFSVRARAFAGAPAVSPPPENGPDVGCLASLVARGRPFKIPGQSGLLSGKRAETFGAASGDTEWLSLLMACPSPRGALDEALADRLRAYPLRTERQRFPYRYRPDDALLLWAAVRERALADPSGPVASSVLSLRADDGATIAWPVSESLVESLVLELSVPSGRSAATARRRV